MPGFLRAFVAAAAVILFSASPVLHAAESPATATVKVALLDMSSIAGPGMGPGARFGGPRGQGMMGPGGGRGDSGREYGPGMMGPGWGWGNGQGPGWMARNMMGPGMMGMGMMSVRVTKDSVKAGKVRFEVVNHSAALMHELEVIAVDDVNAPLPYDYNKAKVMVPEKQVMGEAEDIDPGQEKTLEVTLKPGHYLLVCNVPGHYAAGMVAPFTVTP